MKKKRFFRGCEWSGMKKLLLAMKLTTILLFLSVMAMASGSYSQNTRFDLTVRNASIVQVLEEIERLTEYGFLFKTDQLDLEARYTLDLKGAKIDNVMNEILDRNLYSYRMMDRIIVISKVGTDILSGGDQAPGKVSGKVTDTRNQPLPGVTVVVKGTTQGTVTDADGNYTLTNLPANATLQFSFVGMKTQEVMVGEQTRVNVRMEDETIGLEEVVAVGYGTQQKVNLTGSVSSITADEIENKAVSQSSQALAGLLSGVTVQQGTGNPGKDGARIRIRGIGTFSSAGSDPLVLIDGIPGSLDEVNPTNIDNISVLKDAASAAIYGSRAANGVILITTKKGKEGILHVEYNGYIGVQQAAEVPEFVDSWTYAEMQNEVLLNEGGNIRYTQEEIEKFRLGGDPDNFPNNKRYEWLIQSGTGIQSDNNFIFSGGSENVRYALTFRYLHQDGIVKKNSFDNYNIRLNLDSKINEKLNVSLRLTGSHSLQNEPNPSPNSLLNTAIKLPPTLPGRRSDGTYGNIANQNVEGYLDHEFFSREKENAVLGNVDLTYEIVDNLTITGVLGVRNRDFVDRTFNSYLELEPGVTLTPSNLNVLRRNNTYLNLQAYLKYNKTWIDHTINTLLGFSQEESITEWDQVYRDNFPNNNLHQINAGSEANMRAFGSRSEWALRSFFGRLGYSLKDRYLLEANVRYDGTSRFPEGNRFDLFPSFSAGWRISEEEFFNVLWIDDLKLR
jgi:TonB-linked SusC/RagA family outer membrane protein